MMHRFILGLPRDDPREVDHINGNPLDNRRANLRLVSRAQNKQNLDPRGQANSTSGIRGVSWDTQAQKWRATAHIDGVQYRLGRFATKDCAGEAVVAFRRERMPFSARD